MNEPIALTALEWADAGVKPIMHTVDDGPLEIDPSVYRRRPDHAQDTVNYDEALAYARRILELKAKYPGEHCDQYAHGEGNLAAAFLAMLEEARAQREAISKTRAEIIRLREMVAHYGQIRVSDLPSADVFSLDVRVSKGALMLASSPEQLFVNAIEQVMDEVRRWQHNQRRPGERMAIALATALADAERANRRRQFSAPTMPEV